jgi:hypothetical protein
MLNIATLRSHPAGSETGTIIVSQSLRGELQMSSEVCKLDLRA